MLTLLGVVVVVIGFARRMNPLLVVLAAILVTSVAAGMSPVAVVAAIGKTFTSNRFMAASWLMLPLVGTLERMGLRERAQTIVRSIGATTAGRVLLAYLVIRQAAAALGLTALGGHAQMVRPLVAPMAEAAAARGKKLSDTMRFRIRAFAAATDNVGLFFGEDIFIAIGSILLMKGFLHQNGIDVEPLDLAKWAVPTAVVALVVHGIRLLRLDRAVDRDGSDA
jgi:uncharacterized membrane protein